jgi:hypothetical protein
LLSDSVFDLALEPYDCDKDILGSGATTARKTNRRVLLAGSSQPHKELRRQELPLVSSQGYHELWMFVVLRLATLINVIFVESDS